MITPLCTANAGGRVTEMLSRAAALLLAARYWFCLWRCRDMDSPQRKLKSWEILPLSLAICCQRPLLAGTAGEGKAGAAIRQMQSSTGTSVQTTFASTLNCKVLLWACLALTWCGAALGQHQAPSCLRGSTSLSLGAASGKPQVTWMHVSLNSR